MRIVFLSDHFKPEPSAGAAHVFERARLWVKWGHDVTVVTCAPNLPEGKVYPGYRNHWRFVEYMDGVRVVRVKTFITRNEGFFLRCLDFLSFWPSALLFSLFEAQPDVVIATSPHLFVPVAGLCLSRLRGVPHVMEVRDLWPASILATSNMQPGRLYRLLEQLELFLYRKSSRIVCLSRSFTEDLTGRGVPADKVDLVINGANLELFAPRPRDPEIESRFGLQGRFVVGYLGTLGAAHGLERVVEAASLLRDTDITFLFVGVGAAREQLERQAREMGLENVVFTGRQLKEEMPRFWSVCDAALVHLRNDEVFKTVIPSKIFEAMAMGKPILYGGPRGEGAELIECHEAGLIAPPDDPQALADAVLLLRHKTDLRATLAAQSHAAAPRYSRERQAEDTFAVLARATQTDGRLPRAARGKIDCATLPD